ncbi:MAG TPA: universal stress protein [Chloroflexia bacterium]|nr:universal stress protein [Chloroflexia bacterium]
MDKCILVPLDGSALAEMALPHAVALARTMSKELILVRVVPMPLAYNQAIWGAPVPTSVWEISEEEAKSAREHLARTAEKLDHLNIEVHTQVLEGDPAAMIIAYAEQHPRVATIAMSTHGRSGLGRWFFGSVAEKVLQAAPVPLLLVRAAESESARAPRALDEARYDTILVPLDGSPLAELAVEPAQHIAATTGAKLILISAVVGPPVVPELITSAEERTLWDQEIEWQSSYLGEVKARLLAEGLEADSRVVSQPPAEAIVQMSERGHADLIVMSTHGRGGLQRLWLGSVAIKVVRGTGLPVLLVRAKERVASPELQHQAAPLALLANV